MTATTTDVDLKTLQDLRARVDQLEQRARKAPNSDAISIVVFSGELDKMLAAFVIATGAAASGMSVSMFFTFWGTAALKKQGPQASGKSIVERMFGWMLPGGLHRRKLSRMDMLGVGRRMMMQEMKKKGAPDLASLVDIAQECEVEINVCEMSMSLMGIQEGELIDYPNVRFCGVASFLETSSNAGTTLFI